MADGDPILRREGNLRLAGIAADGLPSDLLAARATARAALPDEPGIRAYGPAQAIVERLPLADDPPATWRCQAGTAVIGEPPSRPPLLVEDFRGLQSLSLPHYGPVSAIPALLQRLGDHARAMGWMTRPYWRLAIATSRAPDGHLVPEPLVSIFIDR